MNYCEMTYCILYALGQPRTVGVSAWHVFERVGLQLVIEVCPQTNENMRVAK